MDSMISTTTGIEWGAVSIIQKQYRVG